MNSRIGMTLRLAMLLPLLLLGSVTITATSAGAATPPFTFGQGSGFCASAAPGGRNLLANFDNVYACAVGNGPGSSYVPSSAPYRGYFEDAPFGFQCVELADRFLFDVYHLAPIKFGALTGAIFVQSAITKYPSLPNGTNGTPNEPFLAGDIVSFSGGAGGNGHVAIITKSSYLPGDGGNYSVSIMEENAPASGKGTTTAKVLGWRMGSPADSSETPTDFIGLPVPTASSAADHVLVVSATGTSYFVDSSGVPHWIPDVLTYDCDAAAYPVWSGVTQSEVNALGNGQPWATRCSRPQDAANHILVVGATNTSYWVDASGVPHWIPTAAIFNCLANQGVPVLRDLVQSQVDTLGNGQPWATCGSTTTTADPPPPTPTAPPASTWPEVSNPDGPTHTWSDYSDAGGTEGATIPDGSTVLIACRVQGLSAGGTTWWYRVASSPWNGSFYASASAFYNTGTNTSGPFDNGIDVDPSVATC